jgi:prevent-host-death family protein
MQVNVLEAKTRLSQLIKAALAGEEIVIARRGEPAVRLIPTTEKRADPGVGRAETIIEWLRAHPLPAYARRSAQEIDAAIAEERCSWD